MAKKQKKPQVPERSVRKELFPDLEHHIHLPSRETKQLLADYDRAINLYQDRGLSDEEICKRLATERLGGFYAHAPVRWYALDPAEKLYPLGMRQGEMPLFRMSVYLRAEVIPELLQMALNFMIKRFPSFATTVKSGIFWHYLDSTKKHYTIEEEKGIACSPIHVASSGSQVFRILYHQKRISVEFFHVVTDGTGGMIFLKALTAEYLRLAEGIEPERKAGRCPMPADPGVWDPEDAPDERETANEFLHVELFKGSSGFTGKPGVQLGGKLSKMKPCRILHFEMSAAELKEKAHQYQASITAYMLGIMFMAHKFATEATDGPVIIQVPVNIRKFHPSVTLRNDSMYAMISLELGEISTMDEIMPKIQQQLKEKGAKEPMDKMVSTAVKMVAGLRPIPRFIKRPVAEKLYGFLGDRLISDTLSNMGVVRMPEEDVPFIEKFDFILGPSVINRAACAMVTFEDHVVFSVTKTTVDPSFEERISKLLDQDELMVRITGSPLYEY
ncbi:MAG: hypothetical protein K6A77_03105 [Clostridiales bacterium]|nr:hypothetical protein [Clostridiales bacterium]